MAIPKLIQITPINADSQTLNATDTALVSSNVQENNFNVDTDLIDAYVYNVNNALIRKITTQYSVLDTKVSGSEVKSLYIDPIKDLQSNLYTQGIYKVDYNFLIPKLYNNEFYIVKEIIGKNKIKGKYWNWLEINNSDIEQSCLVNNLVDYLEDDFDKVAWVCKIKRK
jgi:hypothetical protein